MKCEMVLCVEGGPAHELKWCPLPSHDDVGPLILSCNVLIKSHCDSCQANVGLVNLVC